MTGGAPSVGLPITLAVTDEGMNLGELNFCDRKCDKTIANRFDPPHICKRRFYGDFVGKWRDYGNWGNRI